MLRRWCLMGTFLAVPLLCISLPLWVHVQKVEQRYQAALNDTETLLALSSLAHTLSTRNRAVAERLHLQIDAPSALLENAAVLEASGQRLDASPDLHWLKSRNLDHDLSADDLERFRQLLEAEQDTVARLLSLAEEGLPWYEIDLEAVPRHPRLLPFVTCVNLLALQGDWHLHQREDAEAVAIIRALYQLGEIFSQDPTELSQLLRYNLHELGHERLKSLWQREALPAHEMDLLSTQLRRICYDPMFEDAALLRWKDFLKYAETTRATTVQSLKGSNSFSKVLPLLYGSRMGNLWHKKDVIRGLEMLTEWARSSSLPPHELLPIAKDIEREATSLSGTYLLAPEAVSLLADLARSKAHAETLRRLAIAALEVDVARKNSGGLPETLPASPESIDPYTGKQFRYLVHGTNVAIFSRRLRTDAEPEPESFRWRRGNPAP